MKVTISIIKADVGSIGGHTRPSEEMLESVRQKVADACTDPNSQVLDGMVTHTGDDIAILVSHRMGINSELIHQFAWNCFIDAAQVASSRGLYAAGQDLLVDAPSGNIRGAGPAVSEIEFNLDSDSNHRRAEAFVVIAADKCGPGAYNYPLYSTFCDPMRNSGLLISPELNKGFVFDIIDTLAKTETSSISLEVPERVWDVAALLQNPDRFVVGAIRSRSVPNETIAAISATRLNQIAGKYVGKDDPVAVIRTQGIFPAPEEVVEPYMIGHFVSGGSRGSHVMPIMPVAINSTVAGPFTLPLVSCLAFSMAQNGSFTSEYVDMFADRVWDNTRLKVQRKIDEWRRQGFVGPTLASEQEVSYTGLSTTVQSILDEFNIV